MQQPISTPLLASHASRAPSVSPSPGVIGFIKFATAFGIGHSVILAGIVTAAVWLLSWLSLRTRPL